MRNLLALWVLLATPFQAIAFSAMQAEDCAAAWEKLTKTSGSSISGNTQETHSVSEDGWCLTPRVAAAPSGIDFDRFEWRAEGLQRYLQHSLAPAALAIRVTDADMLRKYGVKEVADAPAIPMQIVLVLRENAQDRQLLIEKLLISGPNEAEVFLTGVFHDVDLSSTGKMQISLGSAKLRDVALVAKGTRGLDRYIRPYFGATFPERSRRRTEMTDKVSDWPDNSFPPKTKRAVKQLIAALPSPSGTLRVDVDTGPGISAASFMRPFLFGEPGAETMKRLLETTVFNATWARGE